MADFLFLLSLLRWILSEDKCSSGESRDDCCPFCLRSFSVGVVRVLELAPKLLVGLWGISRSFVEALGERTYGKGGIKDYF